MASLRNLNGEYKTNFSHMQRYFRSNSISLSLCVRVRRHVDYKIMMHSKSIQEKDVKFLQLLSEPLQIDLHYEVYSHIFRSHAFFLYFDHSFRRCMKKICHEAVESVHASEGDTIF